MYTCSGPVVHVKVTVSHFDSNIYNKRKSQQQEHSWMDIMAEKKWH